MIIRFNKSKDPSKLGGMTCIRDDGTSEYQPLPYGPGFIAHDLTHFAVETVLGLRDSFFGLVSRGHKLGMLDQVTDVWQEGTPVEAIQTEFIVNQFQHELVGNVDEASLPKASEVNEQIAMACRNAGLAAPRPVTQDQADQVRAKVREMLQRWRGVTAGGVMELRWQA